MAQGDLPKLKSRLHTAVTSARRRSRPGRYGRTEWPWVNDLLVPDPLLVGGLDRIARYLVRRRFGAARRHQTFTLSLAAA